MPKKKMGKPIAAIAEPTVESRQKHVLVAILGTSPAVLTEAVWALAVKNGVVPDEIVVFTTQRGKEELQEQIFGSDEKRGGCAWSRLQDVIASAGCDVSGKLVFDVEGSVHLFKNKQRRLIDDLRSREDNLEAANMMMKEIRDYADDGNCVIHALLSGGRKTMTALFFSCVSLLARSFDHIYHVLAEDPYDKKLDLPFFFPEKVPPQRLVKVDGAGEKNVIVLKYEKAKIDLFEVPFIYMGEWAEQRCRAISKNLSYENIINAVQESFNNVLFPDSVVLDFTAGRVEFDGKEMKTSKVNFMVLAFLLQGFNKQEVIKKMNDLKVYMHDEDEDNIEFRDNIMQRLPWLYKLGWRGKEKNIQQKFLHYGAKKSLDGLLSNDFSDAQYELKTALCAVHQDAMFRLLFEKNLRASAGVFNPEVRVVCRTGAVPEALMEYFFPEDAPFRFKEE